MDALANFAYSTVSTAPSPGTSGTSLAVAAGQGSRFPATPFNAVVWPNGQIPTPANAEIVRVTARASDTLTLTRTQESTSARAIIVGDQIAAAITAKMLTDITGAISADVVFVSNQYIRRNTSDGSDNGVLAFCGGGDLSETRGAFIRVFGNESGAVGAVVCNVGNVSGSSFSVVRGDGITGIYMDGINGSTIFTSNAAAVRGWNFNNTSTNGSSLWVQRSGLDIGGLGPAISAASNVDLELWANAKLYLTAAGGQVLSTTIKADTTANAANMVVDATTGRMQRSTSSVRYKTNIQSMIGRNEWSWLLSLRPVTFNSKDDPDGRRYGGLLAEDVARHSPSFLGRPLYAGLDKDGNPDDVAYGHLTAPIILALQDISARLDQLERSVSWKA